MIKKIIKIIAAIAVAVAIFIIIFLNVPRDLSAALRFDESEWLIVLIVILENVDGRASADHESIRFEKGDDGFTAINDALAAASYSLTLARDRDRAMNAPRRPGGAITVHIMNENNTLLYLTNRRGVNMTIDGTLYRMKYDDINKLIENIIYISGM